MFSIVKTAQRVSPRVVPGLSSSQTLHTSSNHFQASHPIAKTEGRTQCTLIPGDGVGPELCQVVLEVFKAAGVPIDFDEYFLTEIYPQRSAKIETVVESIKENGICLKGILASPDIPVVDQDAKTLNMKLRDALDLYANVVHVRSLPGLNVRHKNVDMVVIREQTEGEYSCLEHESVPGVVECLKITTRAKSERIAKFAFDYATRNNRKQVTAVHKANIMKLGDGLFLKCCSEVAKLYPKIEYNNMIVDNCTMQLVSNPHQFDVMVLPNLYGNIVDNLSSGLVGGAGVVAGASYSKDAVVFEPGARHTFSEAVGKNVANPTAMLLCASKMLRHVNLHYYSELINDSLLRVIKSGKVRTKDMGGHMTTKDFSLAVIDNLYFN